MQREGSPWQGLGVVISKEVSDQVTSIRMFVVELLVVLIAVTLFPDLATMLPRLFGYATH